MSDPAHPITLVRAFFVRSSVISVPGYVAQEGVAIPGPENTIEVRKVGEGGREFEGIMRTTLNPSLDKAFPYSIDMECVAHLTVDETLSDEEATRGVYVTAHSVLYGAIREAVAWITGRHPYGQFMLGLSVLRSAPKPPEPPSR